MSEIEEDIVQLTMHESLSPSSDSTATAAPLDGKPGEAHKPTSRFVRDVTIPDGCKLPPLAAFVKTWRLRNDGSVRWPRGSYLSNYGGDGLLGPSEDVSIPVPPIAPGEEADISLHIISPSAPGRHVGYFRLQDSDRNWFGQRIWCDIQVVGVEEAHESPPSAPVEPPPSPTPREEWRQELSLLSAMGFVNEEALLPLLREHLGSPVGSSEDQPNPSGLQTLIFTLLSNA
jgi:hypothetical protein